MVQHWQTWKIFHLDDTYLGDVDCSYLGLDVFRTFQSQSSVIFSSSAVLSHICRFLGAKLLRKIKCCFKTVPVLTVKPQTKMRKKNVHFSFHLRRKAKLLFSVMFLTLTVCVANFFSPVEPLSWGIWSEFNVDTVPSRRLGRPTGGDHLWVLLQPKSFYKSMLSTTVADISKFYREDVRQMATDSPQLLTSETICVLNVWTIDVMAMATTAIHYWT